MSLYASIFIASLISASIASYWSYFFVTKPLRRTVERQNDTIQRLIQREPVTYQEVGAKPPNPSKEVYAAWGSQMVNIDEDERQ